MSLPSQFLQIPLSATGIPQLLTTGQGVKDSPPAISVPLAGLNSPLLTQPATPIAEPMVLLPASQLQNLATAPDLSGLLQQSQFLCSNQSLLFNNALQASAALLRPSLPTVIPSQVSAQQINPSLIILPSGLNQGLGASLLQNSNLGIAPGVAELLKSINFNVTQEHETTASHEKSSDSTGPKNLDFDKEVTPQSMDTIGTQITDISKILSQLPEGWKVVGLTNMANSETTSQGSVENSASNLNDHTIPKASTSGISNTSYSKNDQVVSSANLDDPLPQQRSRSASLKRRKNSNTNSGLVIPNTGNEYEKRPVRNTRSHSEESKEQKKGAECNFNSGPQWSERMKGDNVTIKAEPDSTSISMSSSDTTQQWTIIGVTSLPSMSTTTPAVNTLPISDPTCSSMFSSESMAKSDHDDTSTRSSTLSNFSLKRKHSKALGNKVPDTETDGSICSRDQSEQTCEKELDLSIPGLPKDAKWTVIGITDALPREISKPQLLTDSIQSNVSVQKGNTSNLHGSQSKKKSDFSDLKAKVSQSLCKRKLSLGSKNNDSKLEQTIPKLNTPSTMNTGIVLNSSGNQNVLQMLQSTSLASSPVTGASPMKANSESAINSLYNLPILGMSPAILGPNSVAQTFSFPSTSSSAQSVLSASANPAFTSFLAGNLDESKSFLVTASSSQSISSSTAQFTHQSNPTIQQIASTSLLNSLSSSTLIPNVPLFPNSTQSLNTAGLTSTQDQWNIVGVLANNQVSLLPSQNEIMKTSTNPMTSSTAQTESSKSSNFHQGNECVHPSGVSSSNFHLQEKIFNMRRKDNPKKSMKMKKITVSSLLSMKRMQKAAAESSASSSSNDLSVNRRMQQRIRDNTSKRLILNQPSVSEPRKQKQKVMKSYQKVLGKQRNSKRERINLRSGTQIPVADYGTDDEEYERELGLGNEYKNVRPKSEQVGVEEGTFQEDNDCKNGKRESFAPHSAAKKRKLKIPRKMVVDTDYHPFESSSDSC